MTSRIVVGYTATRSGADAVALGGRLAAATGSRIELVLVLPWEERSVITPASPGYERHLHDQAKQWLADAASAIPEGVDHHEHVRFGESIAAGLTAAAEQLKAALIVVGAAEGGQRGRHRLGSTAAELLHSATVPVALAPKGTVEDAAAGVARITVATGARPGSKDLLGAAVDLASATGAAVRLVSLVAVDLPATVDTGLIRVAGAAHAADVLAEIREALPASIPADVLVAQGEGIDDAVRDLSWQAGEIAMVGSSRLARKHRLFLGATAAKILRVVPVPLIVVPRKPRASAPRFASRDPK